MAASGSSSTRVDGNNLPVGSLPAHDGLPAWNSLTSFLSNGFQCLSLSENQLARDLAEQPAVRPVEWNRYRRHRYDPRDWYDYCAFMIYVSGEVNPDPCKYCQSLLGLFERCVIPHHSIRTASGMGHVCANCTYHNRQNEFSSGPLSNEEWRMVKLRKSLFDNSPHMEASFLSPTLTGHSGASLKARDEVYHGYTIPEPTERSILPEGFADKVRRIRSWSPASLRRMKAEVSQWQAAVTTVEAEKTPEDDTPEPVKFERPTLPSIASLLNGPMSPELTAMRPPSTQADNESYQPMDCDK